MARDECANTNQELTEIEPGHFVACAFAQDSRVRASKQNLSSFILK
jgi:hypothetical protein